MIVISWPCMFFSLFYFFFFFFFPPFCAVSVVSFPGTERDFFSLGRACVYAVWLWLWVSFEENHSKRHTERTTSNSQFECWQKHNAHVSRVRVWVCAIVYIVSFCFTVMKFVQWKDEIIVFSSCFFSFFFISSTLVCSLCCCYFSILRLFYASDFTYLIFYWLFGGEPYNEAGYSRMPPHTHQIGFATKCAIGFILRFHWMVRQIALKRFHIMRITLKCQKSRDACKWTDQIYSNCPKIDGKILFCRATENQRTMAHFSGAD